MLTPLALRECLFCATRIVVHELRHWFGGSNFEPPTQTEKADVVEKELLDEADLLRLDGLTEQELKRATAKVIGHRKIARQDLGGLAMTTALDELYGLGYAYSDSEVARYDVVTLDQVKAVARKYLRPEALVIASIRPAL